MASDSVTLSTAGQGVSALQDEASILDQEIFILKQELQRLQNLINQKETQRIVCLQVAAAFICYQSRSHVYTTQSLLRS